MIGIEQPWVRSATSQKLCSALTDQGGAVYFVGGCVRNALLGVSVTDLDLATDIHPDEIMNRANRAGLKALPTGIDHGTVTVICDGETFEITTFRKDVATDGRRAVVAFSQDMSDDAARRDFTMNALYVDPNGVLFDPLGGIDDLRARRVRFIGTAANRIREDYLRILRYFRFHAWYGDVNAGHDPDALAAIAGNLEGLPNLSRERVGQEFLKLLDATDPAPAVAAMRQTGVLAAVLGGADDRALAPLVYLQNLVKEFTDARDPLLRLAALGPADQVAQTLRLSKAQERRVVLLRDMAMATAGVAELTYRYGRDDALAGSLLRAALLEMPMDPNLGSDLARGASAVFPVTARDLMPKYSGAALGQALKGMETRWIKSGFTLTKSALLDTLD